MRTVNVTIDGVEYPMCLTLWAYGKICERHESLPKCLEELDRKISAGDQAGAMSEYVWLAHILMEGQWQRSSWDTEEPPVPPDERTLLDLICPGDIPEVQSKVLECLRVGQIREVEVEPPKSQGVGGSAPSRSL